MFLKELIFQMARRFSIFDYRFSNFGPAPRALAPPLGQRRLCCSGKACFAGKFVVVILSLTGDPRPDMFLSLPRQRGTRGGSRAFNFTFYIFHLYVIPVRSR